MAKSVAVGQPQGANETAWFTCGLSATARLTTVRQRGISTRWLSRGRCHHDVGTVWLSANQLSRDDHRLWPC
jgi:hypothetical protein